MKLKVEINQQDEFEIESREHETLLNGNKTDWSIIKTGSSEFLIHKDNKVYNIVLIERKENHLGILINGYHMTLHVKDHIAQILEKLGMDVSVDDTVNEINAPMPGAIIDVMVNEGDEINEGDTLLILEAMKMENIIKSPITGKVEKLHVTKGENVEKNQTLISF